ncbi:MAG TPA: winged helix-turn-helix transcriptional regulator [Candidatus Thermoplasmatota archaeon]|nr:winged helix-turn-helix transcriptional regulator [Candidatus Thermoplasmatota archaeon]
MRVLLLAALVLLAYGATPAGLLDAPVGAPAVDAPSVGAPSAPSLHAPDLPPVAPGAPEVADAIAPLGVDADVPEALPAVGSHERAPLFPGAPSLPPLDTPAGAAAVATGGAAVVLIGFALYSRLARSELLDHERRDGVLKLIKGSPGISLSDVAHKTGLAWGTAVYHLERLEKAGFITSEKNSGRRCYFPVGAVPREDRAGLGTLQQETTRDIAALVVARPGLTQAELCAGLGLSASAASKQVSKLESAGLVRREREWKTVKLHPEPTLATLLTTGGHFASA